MKRCRCHEFDITHVYAVFKMCCTIDGFYLETCILSAPDWNMCAPSNWCQLSYIRLIHRPDHDCMHICTETFSLVVGSIASEGQKITKFNIVSMPAFEFLKLGNVSLSLQTASNWINADIYQLFSINYNAKIQVYDEPSQKYANGLTLWDEQIFGRYIVQNIPFWCWWW